MTSDRKTVQISARAVEPEYVRFNLLEGDAGHLVLELADAVIDGEDRVVKLGVILLAADLDTIQAALAKRPVRA